MTTYRIISKGIDATDTIETLDLSDEGDDRVNVFEGDEALFIRSNYDAFGGDRDMRVIPWRRILYYKKTG